MNPLQDAFISYGRVDSKQFAKKLNDRLAGLGYTVWFDFNDIPLGVDYQKQIDDGIEKADNFLYVISPHSVNSPYCGLEVELALKRKKRIIPLLHVEAISHETWQQRNPGGTDEQWQEYQAAGKHSSFPNMHPEIGKINWVYFREAADDFEQSLQGLLALLEREKDYVHRHTVLLNDALDWERNQKQTRYLLTGEDRQQAETWLATRFKDSQPPVVPTDLHYEYITESIKNGNNLMTQVFLSHAEEDAVMTDKVRRTLMRSGITTWTYRADIEFGSDFESAIKRGVEETDNVLFLMSSYSLRSKYCQQELELANQLNKRLIIMLAGAVDETEVPVTLRNLQYIDLTDNETEADYLKDEDNLLRVLKQDATYLNEHKVLLTKALKWERQQRNPCILLQGYELQHAQAWREVAQTRDNQGPTAIQAEFIEASKNQTAAVSPDVFISYSRADSDFARKLNNALQRQRKRTWFDQESIASGSDFQQEIYKGIETSNFFLFVLSPRAVQSQYCADEVEYAAKLNKRVVTVLHRPVDAADLHPELAKVQWIDFNGNEGEFDANFKELLRTLDTDPVHLRYHTGLLMKAIEWDKKGRREEVLLRGSDLAEAEQWMVQSVEKEPSPTALQGDYVTESRGLLEANRQAATRRQRLLVGVLTALSIVATIGCAVALVKTNEANEAKNKALGRQLATEAESLRQTPSQFTQATLLAVESQKRLTNSKASTAAAQKILNDLLSMPVAIAQVFEASTELALGIDGETFASYDENGITLWDIDTQEIIIPSAQMVLEFRDRYNNSFGVLSGSNQLLDDIDWDTDFFPESQNIWQLSYLDPDKQFAALIAPNDKKVSVRLLNLATKKEVALPVSNVQDISSEFDDAPIVSVDHADRTLLWDLEANKKLDLPIDKINYWYASANKQYIGVKHAGGWLLWDRKANKEVDLPVENLFMSLGPNGRYVFIFYPAGTLLWDLEVNKEVDFPVEIIRDMSLGSNGRYVAINHVAGTLLWDLEANKKLDLPVENIESMFLEPNGRYVVIDSADGTLLWDLEANKKLDLPVENLRDVSTSAAGHYMAVSHADGSLLWNTDINEKVALPIDNVQGISFSHDERYAVISNSTKTILWNLRKKQAFSLPNANIGNTLISDDERYAVINSDAGTLLWELNAQPSLSATIDQIEVQVMAFSPDGRYVIVDNGTEVRVWAIETNQTYTLEVEPSSNLSEDVFSSEDGLYVVINGKSGAKLWHLEKQMGVSLPVKKVARSSPWEQAIDSNDDRYLIIKSESGAVLWDLKQQQKVSLPLKQYSYLSLSKDSRYVDIGNESERILWDLEKQESVSIPLEDDSWFSLIENSHYVIILNGDGSTQALWDLEKQQPVSIPLAEGSQLFLNKKDNRYVVVESKTGNMLWDLKEQRSVSLSVEDPKWLSFSEDDRNLIAGDENETLIKDLETEKEVSLPVTVEFGLNVSFSADDQYVATVSDEYKPQIWDLETGQEIHIPSSTESRGEPLLSEDSRYVAINGRSDQSRLWHFGADRLISLPIKKVVNLIYSRDGNYMAIHGDETSVLWDIKLDKAVVTINHGKTVGKFGEVVEITPFVGFSTDDTYFIAHGEKEAKVWRLDEETLVEDACNRLTRNLTVREWQRRVGDDEPYRRTCTNLPFPDDYDSDNDVVSTDFVKGSTASIWTVLQTLIAR